METALEKNTNQEGDHYEPTATTNGIRFQTDVIISLLENGADNDLVQSKEACLLFIGYEDWYEAFKIVNHPYEETPYVE